MANCAWLSGSPSLCKERLSSATRELNAKSIGIEQLVFSADWAYVPMTGARAFVEKCTAFRQRQREIQPSER